MGTFENYCKMNSRRWNCHQKLIRQLLPRHVLGPAPRQFIFQENKHPEFSRKAGFCSKTKNECPRFCREREANPYAGFSSKAQKMSILLNQTTLTFVALGPLGPWAVSNSTSSPSFRDLNPSPVIAEW